MEETAMPEPLVPAATAPAPTDSTPPAEPQAQPQTPPPADPPADDKPLGPNGEKALQAERDARKALEKQIAELAPLKALADVLGTSNPADAKSELEQLNERITSNEKDLAAERQARFRAEVALAKSLTPEQVAVLQGSTLEELSAHADQLVALFGQPAGSPQIPPVLGTPKPDPTQGPRGPVDIDAQIRDAEAKGDVTESIRLKQLKFTSK